MVERDDNYKNIELFMKTYVKHGLEGLAAFHGILDYAQFVDDISYEQSKQLLDDFVGHMFMPEEYED